MTDNTPGGPSLIKLGKLANSKDFGKLEALWPEALSNDGYTWKELLPIAGQVGRQGAVERAEPLMKALIGWVEENKGMEDSLEAVRRAAHQLPGGSSLIGLMKRLYLARDPEFDQMGDLLELVLEGSDDLDAAVSKIELYSQLKPGDFAVDRSFLTVGVVEELDGEKGYVLARFEDRKSEYGPSTVTKLKPRPADYFPGLLLYNPDHLREMSTSDAPALVKLALNSNREGRITYRELKGWVTQLLGDKGWKSWWLTAKPALKRDPIIGMTSGSQPQFRLLRTADRYEDRLRRKFDHAKTPMAKLVQVMNYLDEVNRDEKQSKGAHEADPDLLAHMGNGAAKVAVSVLKADPSLALAGLALHAEVAARGVDVARPNPKAAGKVIERISDAGTLVGALSEGLLQRTLEYLRTSLPERWGEVWAAILLKAGRRQCDSITRVLIEAKQHEALAKALEQAVERPTSSPELLCWMWRTRFTTGPAGLFLSGLDELTERRVADAMFGLLDSSGKLYGMSLEENHLKVLETARTSIATQNNRPVLALIDEADRREGIRLKGIIGSNAGLSPAQRTQYLGYLRSKYADIFLEITREWEEGGTLYTTEGGLRKTEQVLNHIIEEEIPEVARQIGEAASHGDLSENAEYTAALEMRDQLASRATRMDNELKVAKVINHEMAGSDFVNVGTRVVATADESGEEETYTFLGPWDTDVENRVLNYQAPLAMAFMGSKVGDTVTFGEESEQRSWTIKEIGPGLPE
jgi:transcription elongation GreA/GreB family factor